MADGEAPGVPPGQIARHQLLCAACRAFPSQVGALAVDPTMIESQGAQPPADLTDRILGRLAADREVSVPKRARAADPERQLVTILRIGLLVPAISYLTAAIAALNSTGTAGGVHTSHDLGALALALSIGFVLAAFRPRWAGGFVPLLGAVVVCLAIVSICDMAMGRATPTTEVPHLVDALGLAILVVVARHQPRADLRARLA